MCNSKTAYLWNASVDLKAVSLQLLAYIYQNIFALGVLNDYMTSMPFSGCVSKKLYFSKKKKRKDDFKIPFFSAKLHRKPQVEVIYMTHR